MLVRVLVSPTDKEGMIPLVQFRCVSYRTKCQWISLISFFLTTINHAVLQNSKITCGDIWYISVNYPMVIMIEITTINSVILLIYWYSDYIHSITFFHPPSSTCIYGWFSFCNDSASPNVLKSVLFWQPCSDNDRIFFLHVLHLNEFLRFLYM